MIDLTPLDVRKKKGDFRRGLRGYDPPQVDDFLEIVADRLESLVRENLALQERVARLENQVTDYREREKALTEALVTAQEMREEVRVQSAREADAARREAENDAVRIRAEAQQVRDREEAALRRLRGRQLEFLQTYRAFLERELAELASTVRGLELNGTMDDALITPPRLPDPAVESGAAGAAAVVDVALGADPGAHPEDEWATSESAVTSVRPPEPELILSDDDVLSDDDGAATDSPEAEPGPEPEAETEAAEPTRPVEAAHTESDLDLDPIPELDDIAGLGDVGREDAVRPPLDAKAVDGAEPAGPDAQRSASKRREIGDDTDDLLRSLFGDEH